MSTTVSHTDRQGLYLFLLGLTGAIGAVILLQLGIAESLARHITKDAANIVFLVGTWFGVKHWMQRIPFKTTRYEVQKLLYFAAGTLIFVLPTLSHELLQWPWFTGKSAELFNHIQGYVLMLFGIVGTHQIFRLILQNKDKFTDKLLQAVEVFLLALIVADMLSRVLWFSNIIFYIAGGILLTIFASRLRWVAFIQPKNRYFVLASLLPVAVISTLFLWFYFTREGTYFFNLSANYNTLFIGLMVLVAAYTQATFFALLFFLPLSGIVSQHAKETRSMLELNDIVKKQLNVEQVFNYLFENAMEDTRSAAGWMQLNYKGKGDASLKSRNINAEHAQQIIGWLKQKDLHPDKVQRLVTIKNLKKDTTAAGITNGFKSLIAANITVEGRDVATLYLVKDYAGGYDTRQQDTVRNYINQSQLAYENSLLLQSAIQSAQVKEEVNVARRIQQSLVPAAFPHDERWQIAAYTEPSKKVGGDFYDYYVPKPHQLAIITGDVTGKGVPAALHMAEIKGIFQSLMLFNLKPAEFVEQFNKAVSACFERSMFVTLSFILLNSKRKTLKYTRAGHCPMLYYRRKEGKGVFIQDEGMGLGILRNDEYKKHVHVYERHYEPGDILVLFTDGLTEATNGTQQEEFGQQRLLQSVINTADGEAEAIKKAILASFRRFVKSNTRLDDVTLIVIKFT